ncbi:class I SAM-dependent methyltransferase [Pseudonocardia pini]|uniref:class I SAM-dependent methyltransferase n=1 Tax=Pseudonocardia pini TaxID=2758030 RepID=UPI0028A9722C|nr:class I SAM-dependent methyltransferase [Pseudonocardia pini]
MSEDLFWKAHTGLPREAPGSAATTALLLRLAGAESAARILDLGCGTGASSIPLARLTGGEVTAVDLHEPFLAELERTRGELPVRTLKASMDDLPLPAGAFDLVWAEGSAYIVGFDRALELWRSLLAPGGALVLTEAEWLTDHPSAGAREFWAAGYPAMRTTAGNVAAALAAGWTVAATYVLPDADWAAYYGPLAARIEELRAAGADPAGLAEVGYEMEVRERFGADYGYTGYVLRPRA